MFIESPRFPEDISFGVTGGPEFVTEIATNPGGFAVLNATRDMPLHKVDAAHGVRTTDQFNLLKALFMNCRGRFGGFRFKDWSDYQFDFTNGVLVLVSPGVYQITKVYAFGAAKFTRAIKKPVAGTTSLRRNNVPVNVGAYTIDTTTGLATLAPDQSSTVSSVTPGSSTVVSLASSVGNPAALALSGFGGADAALLNGQSFTVTAQSGLTYTLAVNTAGKAFTVGGTTRASVYPGSTEILTAAGEFDLAMRFDTDYMESSIDSRRDLRSWTRIPLVEWRNPG